MRAIARRLRGLWLDWRTLRWLLRLRLALARNGGRLEIARWRGVQMAEQPRLRALPLGAGSGGMTIDLAPGVVFGYGAIVEVWARGENRLELGEGSKVLEGARIELRGGTVRVGARTTIHDNAVLKSDGLLVIGEHARVSYGTCVHCSDRIELGDWAGIAEYVTIVDSDHTPDGSDVPNTKRPIVTEPVVVERNVLFGRGAVILRGARIGANSVVAANAIVRWGSYPPGHLLAGSPAEAVRELRERAMKGSLKPSRFDAQSA